jgi:hypothetical protein
VPYATSRRASLGPVHHHPAKHPKTNVRVTAHWDVDRTSRQIRAELCPLYTQKQTRFSTTVMSALCQPTFAISLLALTGFASFNALGLTEFAGSVEPCAIP